MRAVDELRPLTAGRLLELWRGCAGMAEDPGERALLCNAGVLAECCFQEGKRVFPDGAAVLAEMTPRQMESLLRALMEDAQPRWENPDFSEERFREMEERSWTI